MKKILFFLLVAGMAACANNADGEQTETTTKNPQGLEMETYNTILDRHDEIMPRMGNLRQLAKKLTEWKKDAPAEKQAAVESTIAIIEDAEESMMTWMQELGPSNPVKLRETKSHEEIMNQLAIQEEQAASVEKKFSEAFEAAEELLKDRADTKGISLTPQRN
ncbi:MAG: hypothetical protein GYB31_01325 [Bacteroidetes bacterium]|nr:hypothetical protein [Bacteroidota bacterium]